MIILDGGISRELQRVGAPFRQPEWSAVALMETPALVRQVHAEFIAAGADVITTNSYAIVPFHIGEDRFHSLGLELALLAGKLAREAADDPLLGADRARVRVAGSLPPIFGSYRPDLFDPARVGDYLKVLIEGLAPSVDIWLGETLSSIEEAAAVASAIRGDGRPLWISMTLCDDSDAVNRIPSLRSGESVRDAALWAMSAGVDALLFNCSQPEVMEPAVAAASDVFKTNGCAIPIGVYANAFMPRPDSNSGSANESLMDIRSDLNPASYANWARSWVAAGASIIGGCCGIGVEHIHNLSRRFGCDDPTSTQLLG